MYRLQDFRALYKYCIVITRRLTSHKISWMLWKHNTVLQHS